MATKNYRFIQVEQKYMLKYIGFNSQDIGFFTTLVRSQQMLNKFQY
ncbi:MAG TPA: hypothetical protein VK071_07435 [Tissierellales bacterium]|nr:hypothetical protein [Tissierellales bacterium]